MGGLRVLGVCLGRAFAQAAEPSPTAAAAATPATIPTHRVERYEITGVRALDPAALAQATAIGLGSAVTLPQIRQALVNLQQAFRDQGLGPVALQLPAQALNDGVVRVRATGAGDPSSQPNSANLPEWQAPSDVIRRCDIRGNSVLTVADLEPVLASAQGPVVQLEQLQAALSRLQTLHRDRGYLGASVVLPQQLLADGTAIIVVREGLSPEARIAAQRITPPPVPVAPKPAPVPTFAVNQYAVTGNTLLRPDFIEQVFTNATGPAVTLPQIQKALGELQLAYRERGFATVSVSLPPQQLTNAVVQVQVTEGQLVDIQLAGNQHFSSNNVRRSLPSLRTNILLNSQVLQRELDLANQNRDRQIFPTLGPGPEPGTSALTLRVKDRLPLHGRLEVNNYATPGTPEWRINGSAQYNNLWQREHQAGLSYGFSPEAYKTPGAVTDRFFNRPLIANYGAYYRLPFGTARSVEEQIASSTRFGYDEATRQFRLPPAGSRPDFSLFASASSSDTGIQLSPARIVSQTPLLTIVSRDSGQNISLNEGVGARLSVPLALTETNRWNFSGGFDWKRYFLESFNTNNFLLTPVVTNLQGSQTIESVVASPRPSRHHEVQYLPLSLSADYSSSDRWGSQSASLSLGGNFVGESADFAAAGYSTNAHATYGKATLAFSREQKLPGNASALLRATGQAATGALISNEQFSVGGLNSVRGYFEGDQFGDAGWFTSAELRTPYWTSQVPFGAAAVPVWLRASIFIDYGERYLLEAPAGVDDRLALWGAGFGVSANVNNRVDLRITVGWPLLDTPNRGGRDPRAYFSLGGQF